MSELLEAFKPLADAYKRQFGVELNGEPSGTKIVVSDGTKDGVSRVGSVQSNWLKRNAPKHGFVRQGEGVTFSWNGAVTTEETSSIVSAETAEIAAVVTASASIPPEATSVVFPHEPVEGQDDAKEMHVDVTDDTNEDDIPEGWRSGRNRDRS